MDAPELATVAVRVDGPVGHLTLDRPDKLNALSPQLLHELIAAAAWFDGQPDVRAVIVSGAGDRAFSAGFDLSAATFATDDADVYGSRDLGRAATDALAGMRAVTVAAVRGWCIGGGVVLLSACDLRVVADDATFAIPEVDLGIPLGWGGIPRLVRELGPALTRELVLTCRRFSAAEALAWRFVNRVVPAAEVDAAATELAEVLAGKARLVLEMTSRHIDEAADQLVSPASADRDAGLLALAYLDDEARAAARAYLTAREGRR
ncbi:MAG: enoyl-CoA hydratase/isomerase family protein [Acidimicrobiales bacterium]|nr:enoyl-CoA hydratase/isomerase family protein [Acidimicrobiales bacterium]